MIKEKYANKFIAELTESGALEIDFKNNTVFIRQYIQKFGLLTEIMRNYGMYYSYSDHTFYESFPRRSLFFRIFNDSLVKYQ